MPYFYSCAVICALDSNHVRGVTISNLYPKSLRIRARFGDAEPRMILILF